MFFVLRVRVHHEYSYEYIRYRGTRTRQLYEYRVRYTGTSQYARSTSTCGTRRKATLVRRVTVPGWYVGEG